MRDTFLMVKEISVNLEHSWRAETRYPSVMGLLRLLRILWRATFQPSFEKRSALRRERKRVRDFNRRDRSLDLRAVAQFRRLTPTTAPPQQLVGGATDGGYLVPEIGLAGLSLFSPGVGHVVDFEYNNCAQPVDIRPVGQSLVSAARRFSCLLYTSPSPRDS